MLSPLRELNLTVTHGADTIDGRIIQINMISEWLSTLIIPVKRITQNLTYQIHILHFIRKQKNKERGSSQKTSNRRRQV